MCHFYYTFKYIRTIILRQSVTYITLCNISELLYLRNVFLVLHCAIHQNYNAYAMCHFYYTLQCIRYSLILLTQYVTCLLRCNVSLLLHSPMYLFFYVQLRNKSLVCWAHNVSLSHHEV